MPVESGPPNTVVQMQALQQQQQQEFPWMIQKRRHRQQIPYYRCCSLRLTLLLLLCLLLQRVSAYRRIFAAAYSSVLKTPLPESVVTSIVCGGSTVFNVTADTPPQKALPALRSLLADDFEDLERPESAHRILLQLPPQNSGMKMVTVTTHFLVPAPTSISERLSVVETIKSKAAAVLSGPLRTFFMTPNTWPAGVGQLSGVFTVSHTLPAAADPRNLASGAPPVALAAPVLTFQVVIAVPATDETQSCAAWFGSSEVSTVRALQ